MADITLTKKDETHLLIDSEMGILYELKEHFTFFVDGYKYMKKFKLGVWG